LIKNTKRVELDGFLFFKDDAPTIEALPTIEIQKVIKKGLQHHKPSALFAFHTTTPLFVGLVTYDTK